MFNEILCGYKVINKVNFIYIRSTIRTSEFITYNFPLRTCSMRNPIADNPRAKRTYYLSMEKNLHFVNFDLAISMDNSLSRLSEVLYKTIKTLR